jgi:hypothetical protein
MFSRSNALAAVGDAETQDKQPNANCALMGGAEKSGAGAEFSQGATWFLGRALRRIVRIRGHFSCVGVIGACIPTSEDGGFATI